MKKLKRITVFCLLSMQLFLFSGILKADEATKLGLYVTVLDKTPVLSSRKEIDSLISFASRSHVSDLFVQVYRANKSWFPSKIADSTAYENYLKNVGEDPFALLIKRAHTEGIRVHAWINLLSLGENKDAPILKKYGPEILTKNLKDKNKLEDYKIDHQFFLEPGDLRVRRDLSVMVEEIVLNYPALDGIQFDYIRYPDVNPGYGYTKANIERFKKATGKNEVLEKDIVWRDWKRGQVTDLLEHLVKHARKLRQNIILSSTGCVSYVRAQEEAFQDWPYWINTNLVDFVTIMNYPEGIEEYRKNIADAKKRVLDVNKLYMAVGAYKFTNNTVGFLEQLHVCQEEGFKACVIFHYGVLSQNPVLGEQLVVK